MTWKPIEGAPYQTVILVKNDMMDEPMKATRGYNVPGVGVHPDTTFCTSMLGSLICPTEWKECEK